MANPDIFSDIDDWPDGAALRLACERFMAVNQVDISVLALAKQKPDTWDVTVLSFGRDCTEEEMYNNRRHGGRLCRAILDTRWPLDGVPK